MQIPQVSWSKTSRTFEKIIDIPITKGGTFLYVATMNQNSENINFYIVPQIGLNGVNSHRVIAKLIVDMRNEEIKEYMEDANVTKDKALSFFRKNGFWNKIVGAGEFVIEQPRKKLLLKRFNNRSSTYMPLSVHLETNLNSFLDYWNEDSSGNLSVSKNFSIEDYSKADKSHPNYIENPYEDVLHTIRYVETLGQEVFKKVLQISHNKKDFERHITKELSPFQKSLKNMGSEFDLYFGKSIKKKRELGKRPSPSSFRKPSPWQKGKWTKSKLTKYLTSSINLEDTKHLDEPSSVDCARRRSY